MSQDVEVTSTADGNTATGIFYVRMESRAEYYARRSDECAEDAMRHGLAGQEGMAMLYAEAADMYALVASIINTAGRITGEAVFA